MDTGYKLEYRRENREFDLFFTPWVGDVIHLIIDEKEAEKLRDKLNKCLEA